VLFTLGILLVAAGSLAAASLERRWVARRKQAKPAHADSRRDG
jgi:hypothetical protein